MLNKEYPPFDTVFVGREDVLDELILLKNQLLNGKGNVFLLSQESGAGKTALIEYFLSLIKNEENGPSIISSQCVDITISRQPYEPFSRLLDQIVNMRLPGYDRILKRLAPKILEGLPWIGPLLSEALEMWIGDNRASFAKIQIGADTAIWQYVELLRSFSEIKPMILFIDDIQWCDAASSNLFFAISRQINNMPILLIGNYRPEEMIGFGREHLRPFRLILPELHRYGIVKEVELTLFSFSEVRKYLDAVFSPNNFNKNFIRRLTDQSGGSPLFLVEISRWLYESGYVYWDDNCWNIDSYPNELHTPKKIEAIILKRVNALTREQQRLLKYASVQGEQFRSVVLGGMLRADFLDILATLNDVARSKLIKEINTTLLNFDADWKFQHFIVKQTLYNTLGQMQRIELHRHVASIMETEFSDQLDLLALEIAAHKRAGHLWSDAALYGLIAARKAFNSKSYWDAIEITETALSDLEHLNTSELDIKVELLWILSRVQAPLLLLNESERNAKECLRIAEELRDIPKQISALARLIHVYLRQGETEKLRQIYNLAWLYAMQQDSTELMAYVIQLWIREMAILFPEVTYNRAKLTFDLAKKKDDHPAMILAQFCMGMILFQRKKWEQAKYFFSQALSMIRQMPYERRILPMLTTVPIIPTISYIGVEENCLEFIARIRRESGEWEQAIQDLWEVYNYKSKHGDRHGEAGLKNIIASTYLMAGEVGVALNIHNEALELAKKLNSQRLVAYILEVGLRIAVKKNDMRLLKKKLTMLESINDVRTVHRFQCLILEMNGILALNDKNISYAEKYFEEMLRASEQDIDLSARARAYFGLASCALLADSPNNAEQLALLALENQNKRNSGRKGDTLILLAKIYYSSGDIITAHEYIDKAFRFFKDRKYHKRVLEVEKLYAILE